MLNAYKTYDEKHLDVLDGVRVLLIFIVSWYHIWQQSWLIPNFQVAGQWWSLDFIPRSGYLAVDGMLFLSGLLLLWPVLRNGGQLDVRAFYRRRLIRIVPSYVLALIASLLFTAIPEGRYTTAWDGVLDMLAHLTFTHNLFYRSYMLSPLNGVLWTLGVEMQFYLIFPLLCRALRKHPLITLLSMTGVALLYRLWAAGVEDNAMLINQLPAFLDVYAWGFAAALIIHRFYRRADSFGSPEKAFFTLCMLLGAVLLIQLATAQAAENGIENIRLGQLNRRFFLAACWCVFSVGACFSLPFTRFLLGNRAMKFLASVSYQYYIWHQVFSVRIKEWGLIPSSSPEPWFAGEAAWQWPYTIACFFGTLAIATILTYGFERPVAQMLRARRDKKT